MNNNPEIPLELRRLKAEMALKGLSLTDISIATRVPYLTISRVLNNRLDRPDALAAIKQAVKNAPMPEFASVA